jgi:thiamine-monophosphate kinase
MGGLPRAAVVSLGAPADLSVECCMEIYRGINDLAQRFGCGVVGGDTVRHGGGVVISVSVMGGVERESIALRSGAKPGDEVWVTGRLGGSLKGRHLSFIPRIEEARFLVEHFSVRAMMDLSDGLGSDLFRMAEASGVGFRIECERIPISPDAPPKGAPFPKGSLRNVGGCVDEASALHAALHDGEDFELLFTRHPSRDEKDLARAFSSRFDCGVSRIGTVMEPDHGVTLTGPEGERPLREGGFSHFE